jgi:SepF-like predicted cell division protein (DUF552 family)
MKTLKKKPARKAKSAKQPAVMVIAGQMIVVGTHSVRWDHPGRDDILKAIRNKQWSKIEELVNPVAKVVKFGKNKLVVTPDGIVEVDKQPVDELLSSRILEMAKLNLPVEPLINFVRKTRLNPSFRAQKELYGFIDYGQLPITPSGNFLARKVARHDFMDKHSGTVDWSPGKTVSMPRNKVDDNSENTCSYGLHVYSREYSKHFASTGDAILVVEINPADVVAVPPDYNNTKMRVCSAKVIQKLEHEDDPEFFSSLVYRGGAEDGDRYLSDDDFEY